MPFEDDIRKFTLENFNAIKKFKPSEKQLELVDNLIDSMDLSGKKKTIENNKNLSESIEKKNENEEEPYDPHLVFNPFIQRIFQSIACRATDPNAELPDFEKHITSTYLTRTRQCMQTDHVKSLFKRCAEEFPTKLVVKKQKQEENIFDKKEDKKSTDENKEIFDESANKGEENSENFELNNLLTGSSSNNNKVRRVGTINPVEDFRILAERLFLSVDVATMEEDFEELCLQIQKLVKEFFAESLMHLSENEDTMTVYSFQQKAFQCIKVQREFSIKFSKPSFFNTYMKAFKAFLLNECKSASKFTDDIESFWKEFFVKSNLSLITSVECDDSSVSNENAVEFLHSLRDVKSESGATVEEVKENDEDLLDMM